MFIHPSKFLVRRPNKRRSNAGLMMGRRRRRRANINPALGQTAEDVIGILTLPSLSTTETFLICFISQLNILLGMK